MLCPRSVVLEESISSLKCYDIKNMRNYWGSTPVVRGRRTPSGRPSNFSKKTVYVLHCKDLMSKIPHTSDQTGTKVSFGKNSNILVHSATQLQSNLEVHLKYSHIVILFFLIIVIYSYTCSLMRLHNDIWAI